MGSDEHYPEKAPAHSVNDFWIDPTSVSNANSLQFVLAPGYVTVMETTPKAVAYPGAKPPSFAKQHHPKWSSAIRPLILSRHRQVPPVGRQVGRDPLTS